MGYRVGIDVGGTFTDIICVTEAGEVVLDKTPTTVDDQSRGVMNGLGQLAERVGLLVTEGHRDEIEMRRVHKEQIWDPSYPAPPPIARRRARIPIPQRHGYD